MSKNTATKRTRRKERHDRNVAKELTHKKEAWERGKLIEENRNEGPYSEQYTESLAKRLVRILLRERDLAIKSENPTEDYILRFRRYKSKIRDLIIFWSPSFTQDCSEYRFLKTSLEIYWDEVNTETGRNLLIKHAQEYHGE